MGMTTPNLGTAVPNLGTAAPTWGWRLTSGDGAPRATSWGWPKKFCLCGPSEPADSVLPTGANRASSIVLAFARAEAPATGGTGGLDSGPSPTS